MSLIEKFETAVFWDHPGGTANAVSSQVIWSMQPKRSNAGVPWSSDEIYKIESGEVIGHTDLFDEEITRVYADFRRDWAYMPVFWNCHDFAIRLAYIIVPRSKDVIDRLQELMVALRWAYHGEIYRVYKGITKYGGGAATLGIVAGMSSFALLGGAAIVGLIIGENVMNSQQTIREKCIISLEKQYPELWLLHS
ncbi:hypothetical protein QQS21_000180 [Conoideocrella luteorostrata]|uniref:Uncharacterized protein n=1 Tax=Conoideocrella luteorostrata TaxID=1105319 RepID=A0AAJ0CZG9_9HYPO|nr:hypothetical protein QQS21_000180 [Conoideocrella luteorostrata]